VPKGCRRVSPSRPQQCGRRTGGGSAGTRSSREVSTMNPACRCSSPPASHLPIRDLQGFFYQRGQSGVAQPRLPTTAGRVSRRLFQQPAVRARAQHRAHGRLDEAPWKLRFVTHLDLQEGKVEEAGEIIAQVVERLLGIAGRDHERGWHDHAHGAVQLPWTRSLKGLKPASGERGSGEPSSSHEALTRPVASTPGASDGEGA